nr:MAG TPA: DnaB-like replicative helicase [Caudoviricetes sp.]
MHTDEIELYILSTMFRCPDKAGEAFAALSPADFGTEEYRKIFSAMDRLHGAGAPVDAVTLTHELGDAYQLIIRQMGMVGIVDLAYYAAMLKDQRRMELIQPAALNVAYAETYSAAEEEMANLNSIFVEKKNLRVVPAVEAASTFCDRANATRPEYLRFGMPRLDGILYVELGDMMIVGGYPSSGKTLLSLQMAAELAKKYRVGFFSLETSPVKLTDRLMCHLSRVPLKKIKDRDLGDADWLALTRAAEKLAALKIELVDAGGMAVRDIRALCLSRRYQVIFIDYLQLIAGNGKQSRYEQVTQISQELHSLGRAHGVTVVALAQLKRPEKEKGKPIPPSMADFRESGQIEQDADCALLVYPRDPNDYRSDRVLYIAKNKEGTRAKYELDFDGALQTLTEKPKSYGEIQAENRRASRAAAAEKTALGQVRLDELPDNGEPLPF